ncbi:MAG: cell division protein ZapA [Candidatus Tectomicrobia bacterium]|uniref:Cell division protein ZapA n=1 Tax=Tectimicrobiota bacterium TaxID=2528274 RepID=A0A938AZW6_UNCTE|nr:cell division protein ZapA [Candidatus Tectomicrobia bacterium]
MAEEVEVEIFGQVFRVASGEAAPAYIQDLAYYVNEKMRAIALSTKTMPVNRMAILTALNIADDLFKLRDSYEQSARLVHAKTEQLISLVREQLDSE